MTKFQKLLIEHEFCCGGDDAEAWARHVEDALNNAGLKVVEVYESGPPEDELKPEGRTVEWSNVSDNPWAGLKGNHPLADGRS